MPDPITNPYQAYQNPNDPKTRDHKDDKLGDLETSKYTYANYIYPLDLSDPTSGKNHYVVFHINESDNTQYNTYGGGINGQAPWQNNGQNSNQASDYSAINAGIRGINPDGTLQPGSNANGDSKQGPDKNNAEQQYITQTMRPIQRVATTIVLYMPPEIQTNYAVAWAEENIGMADRLIQRGGSQTDGWASGIASLAHGLGEKANAWMDINLSGALSHDKRMVINNHQEVLFNGVTFRQFNFNFRFTPESEDEAINVDNIIRAFKFYGAPEVLQGWAGRFWIYPAEFDIQYYANGKENLFLNRISTCALTNISVNYTPVGHWSAFRPSQKLQGAPSVCTDIALTFIELEIMTKNRILENF